MDETRSQKKIGYDRGKTWGLPVSIYLCMFLQTSKAFSMFSAMMYTWL